MHMAGITNKEIAERVCHKNGKPFTAEYVAYLIGLFRGKIRKRTKPAPNERASHNLEKTQPL